MADVRVPSNAYMVTCLVSIAFVVLYPIGVAMVARKKLHVGWSYFAFGAVIFLVFQLLTRVPPCSYSSSQSRRSSRRRRH